jgi:hypothetical protein
MLCRPVRVQQRFGGMYCLHLQGLRIRLARSKQRELCLGFWYRDGMQPYTFSVGKLLPCRNVTKRTPREPLISHVNTDDLREFLRLFHGFAVSTFLANILNERIMSIILILILIQFNYEILRLLALYKTDIHCNNFSETIPDDSRTRPKRIVRMKGHDQTISRG